MKLTVALMKFFGRQPNQDIRGFADEVKKLTPEDKTELKAALEKEFQETKVLLPDEHIED